MSTAKKKNQQERNKRSPVVLFLSLISILSLSVAGYTWYSMEKKLNDVNLNQQKSSEQVAEKPAAPVYFPLDTFTISLRPDDDDSDRVLYVGITLRLDNAESETLLKEYLPEVRSRLLVMLSHQNARQLSTEEGKMQLIGLIKEELRKPLNHKQQISVTDVLFNAFILR